MDIHYLRSLLVIMGQCCRQRTNFVPRRKRTSAIVSPAASVTNGFAPAFMVTGRCRPTGSFWRPCHRGHTHDDRPFLGEALLSGKLGVSNLLAQVSTNTIIVVILAFLAGCESVIVFGRWKDSAARIRLQEEADRTIEAAKRAADTERSEILVNAKEAALEIKAAADEEIASERRSLASREQKLDRRDEMLSRQEETIRKQQRGLESSQTRLDTQLRAIAKQRSELEQAQQSQREELERVGELTRDEASRKLMDMMEAELEHERGSALLKHKKQLELQATEQGRSILLTAIQRYAAPHTAESTTSTVDIPNDEMKGRIIGREGRNIRAFEKRPVSM